jgi:hypothetical protein
VGRGVAPDGKKANVTLVLNDSEFQKLVEGKANAQKLFMSGKLKVKGDVMKVCNGGFESERRGRGFADCLCRRRSWILSLRRPRPRPRRVSCRYHRYGLAPRSINTRYHQLLPPDGCRDIGSRVHQEPPIMLDC